MPRKSREAVSTSRSRLDRRRFLKYSTVGATAALAGCNGDGETVGDVEGDTLTVGLLGPLQGEEHVWGTSLTNSGRLALRDLGGEIAGMDVEVVIGDTSLTAPNARDEHRRVTIDEGADVTFGPFTTPAATGMIESVAEQRKLNFAPGPTDISILERIEDEYDRYRYWFAPGPVTNLHFSLNVVNFVNNYGVELWDTAAVYVEEYPPFDLMHDTFERGDAFDLDIVAYGSIADGTRDFGPIWDEVERSGADVALMMQFFTGVPAATQWNEENRPFEYGGINADAQLGTWWDKLGKSGEYLFTMTILNERSPITDLTAEYFDSFITRYGHVPMYFGPITYDAVHMYADAVETMGSTDEADLIPYLRDEAVREPAVSHERLEFNGRGAEPPDFLHHFKWNGMDEDGVPQWIQWREGDDGQGVRETIAPEDLVKADYVRPPWL